MISVITKEQQLRHVFVEGGFDAFLIVKSILESWHRTEDDQMKFFFNRISKRPPREG
jgi:hypothetical protein